MFLIHRVLYECHDANKSDVYMTSVWSSQYVLCTKGYGRGCGLIESGERDGRDRSSCTGIQLLVAARVAGQIRFCLGVRLPQTPEDQSY